MAILQELASFVGHSSSPQRVRECSNGLLSQPNYPWHIKLRLCSYEKFNTWNSRAYGLAGAVLLILLYFLVTEDWYFDVSWPPRYARDNFRRRWVVLYSRRQASNEVERKLHMPKYVLPDVEFPFFESYVISLPNAEGRRRHAAEQMEKAGIKRWAFFDAINGSDPLPMDEIAWYTQGSRLARIKEGVTKTRRHTAALLSHLRLMHKMIAEGREVQAVYEDDFEFLGGDIGFLESLKITMSNLPADWDVLWLYHGPPITKDNGLLGWVGNGVQMMTSNYVTLGLVYTKHLALKLLNEAQIGNNDFDNVIENLGKYREVNAYVTVPELVTNGQNMQSQTEVQGFDN